MNEEFLTVGRLKYLRLNVFYQYLERIKSVSLRFLTFTD
jgi:hypothetical protein